MLSERVRRAFEGFGRGEPEGFVELLDPAVAYRLIGDTALSGVHQGRDTVLARVIAPLAQALATPLGFELEQVAEAGDRVWVQARGRATLRSGAPYANTYCFAFRFRGERAVEVTEYLDTQLVARAFGVPAERAALLRAMDLNLVAMCAEGARAARGGEAHDVEGLTLCVSPRGQAFHNPVLVRDAVSAEAVLAAAEAVHGRRGLPFSIWTRGHADEALADALAAHGFHELARLPAMALLGDPGTVCAPPAFDIRPTTDEAGRRDYVRVTAAAYAIYGLSAAMPENLFARLESLCAPHVQGFVGYEGTQPVAAALVVVTHGVAGINWVGCVEAARGRRYAEAVTWAAVREGFRRGAAFASLQASPMGRRVYERMGFVAPSHYRVLVRGEAET